MNRTIQATLIYAQTGAEVLMLHRASREGDVHSGKWNAPGGKAERGESALETAHREFAEEVGLALPIDRFMPLGMIQFPEFKDGENWCVWVFVVGITDLERNTQKNWDFESSEGQLHWVKKDRVLDLGLWPGDRIFIPWVLAGKPFVASIWYQNSKPVRHWIQGLEVFRV